MYLPTLNRIASFTVTDWRVASYTIVKGITSDTPVEYREPNDLRYGEVTATLVPRRIAGPRTQNAMATVQLKEGATVQNKEGATVLLKEGPTAPNKEGAPDKELAENRRRIEEGVQELVALGDEVVLMSAVREVNVTTAGGVVVIACFSLGSARVFSGFLPGTLSIFLGLWELICAF